MNGIYQDVVLIEDGLRVELTYIGEGESGDYNSDDPNDRPLMRFYVGVLSEDEDGFSWEDLDDGSYCTAIDARSSIEELEEHAATIMRTIKGPFLAGDYLKRKLEELSWIGYTD